MLPCFSALRLGRCRGRVRFAVLPSAPLNGVTSKLFPSLVETATGLAGSTLSNSSTGLSRISANEFPCRTSILIISGDSLYIHCITAQARIFYPNIRSRGAPNGVPDSISNPFDSAALRSGQVFRFAICRSSGSSGLLAAAFAKEILQNHRAFVLQNARCNIALMI
jgi:hypothetical protein